VFLFVFDYWLSGLVKSLWFISDLALLLCISTTR